MPRRWTLVVAPAALAVLAAGCGGGSDGPTGPGPYSAPTTVALTTAVPPTTQSPVAGVQTFAVQGGHSDAPVAYPQVPPVGGVHHPVWVPCAFYDKAVQNEMGVHSLEHGAIWITYRPDVAASELDALAALARSRKDVLVSRWDDGLPSPLVVTAWGRQLRIDSTADPRLAQFVALYAGKGPEPNAPC